MDTRGLELVDGEVYGVEGNASGDIDDGEFCAGTAPGYMLKLPTLMVLLYAGDRVCVAERPVTVLGVAGKMSRFDSGSVGGDDGDASEFRPCYLPVRTSITMSAMSPSFSASIATGVSWGRCYWLHPPF